MSKKVCVLQSSRMLAKEYSDRVIELGKLLPKYDFMLLSGSDAFPGEMQNLARTIHENGGKCETIIPKSLGWPEESTFCAVKTVEDFSEQKKVLMHEADAFVILEGGLGTINSLFEIWSHKILKEHNKPIMLCTSPELKSAIAQMMHLMVKNRTADDHDWHHLEWFETIPELVEKLNEELNS